MTPVTIISDVVLAVAFVYPIVDVVRSHWTSICYRWRSEPPPRSRAMRLPQIPKAPPVPRVTAPPFSRSLPPVPFRSARYVDERPTLRALPHEQMLLLLQSSGEEWS
jgi:hypothetical protein